MLRQLTWRVVTFDGLTTTKGNYYLQGQVSKNYVCFTVLTATTTWIRTDYSFLQHWFTKFSLPGIFIPQECQLHVFMPQTGTYGTRRRTGKTRCCCPAELAGHKSATHRGDRGKRKKLECRSQLGRVSAKSEPYCPTPSSLFSISMA